ncbi:MAG: hypothetical protein IPK91_16485 [Saprospiraceae bacterium]|nr:hypothetical protein [Saprospiraceae bacterium]
MPFGNVQWLLGHLDFDKLTPEQLQTAFAIISKISYTALCFISPSGNGLKVFVEVSTELEYHDIAYLQVQKYYEDATGLKADPSCKDVTRLCFMEPRPKRIQNHPKREIHCGFAPIHSRTTIANAYGYCSNCSNRNGRTRRPQHYIFIQSTNSIHKPKSIIHRWKQK